MTMAQRDLDAFETARPRLFAVSYRMLGSADEAEDAVQDAFLRWERADRDAVHTPAAWLTKAVTNLCVNRLTSARSRREEYVGPWLPEPVLTQQSEKLGPLETAEQRESVSFALLTLLERLTPAERAVYVLREAFDYPHRDIAEILDVTEANSQQLFKRARQRVAEERPRFDVDRDKCRRIAEEFFAVSQTADGMSGLEQLLADDVVAWADGGGKVAGARRPVKGRDKVGRYLGSGLTNLTTANITRFAPQLSLYAAEVNAQPALLATVFDRPAAVLALTMVDGRITIIHSMANPDKLRFIAAQVGDDPVAVLGEPLFVFP
ncbi:MAG: RNA polymerase sigma-70 factor [Stackebrandtia sp.]